MTEPFTSKKLRLPDMRDSVSIASMSNLLKKLLPTARVTKVLPPASSFIQLQACPDCKTELGSVNELYSSIAVCSHCGHHFTLSAHKRIAHLADAGSFRPISQDIQPLDFLGFADEQTYAAKLSSSQQQTGLSDAILIGRCRMGGTETVLAVLDFRFMGGSMGSVVGEQVTVAFEYATKHRLPLVAVVASGGARMQEGIISLMQMPKTAAAVQHFHDSGLLYLSILTSPTTGGVFASFASLGDVIFAEPKAVIGFAGPRVAEQVTGKQLPVGSHRAEILLASGQIDAIIARPGLPQAVAMVLKATVKHRQSHLQKSQTNTSPLVPTPIALNTAWESVNLVRRPDRLTAGDYIRHLSPNFLELHGDRCYGDDPTVVTGLGNIDDYTVLFIGQERRTSINGEPGEEIQTRPQPEGFRKAIRVMELASLLHCPLVTLVDTFGADPGDESERHGIAWSIAHCLSTMSSLPVPIVTAIIGEGASGGAVAFAVADYILMLQNAIYEVIAPEGAATILYRDPDKASQVAEQLKLTASDCLRLGVIDVIIPEPSSGMHNEPLIMQQVLRQHLLHAIAELEQVPVKQLLARRYRKFRHYGHFRRNNYQLLHSVETAVGQGQIFLHQCKNQFPLANIAKFFTLVIHRGTHENSLAS